MVVELIKSAYEVINYSNATPMQKEMAERYLQKVADQINPNYPCCLFKIPIVGQLIAEQTLAEISEEAKILFLEKYNGIGSEIVSHLAYKNTQQQIQVCSSATLPSFSNQGLEKILAKSLMEEAQKAQIKEIRFNEPKPLKAFCEDIAQESGIKIT